jgi:GT2 family glycosyltransferase
MSSLAEVAAPQTHLLLVDNAGNTLIDDLDISAFDGEIIRASQPLGFAEANNLALVRACRLESAVVFLNQDTLSRENWINSCLRCLDDHPEVAAVTPLTRNYDGTDWDPYFLECAHRSSGFARALDAGDRFDSFYSVPTIPAAAMVVRSLALAQVGPFDPVYGSYYEDYDLCHRFRKAGWKVGISTGGTVCHYSGSATWDEAAERRRARWVTRNRVIIDQRTRGSRRLTGVLKHAGITFPRGLVRSLLRRPGAKAVGPYLAAHWDLLKLSPRLLSERRDQAIWGLYLRQLGWPPGSLLAQPRSVLAP